jgi:endonuclease-3
MKNPKTQSVAAPARREAGAVKPRPRPVRPYGYTRAEIHEIFRRFSVQRPEPKSELDYRNAFTLLVAVVLSAQATDVGVNRATRALFAAADTPEKMVALGEEEVGRFIRTIGLWRGKAKNVIALSEALLRDHGGVVPDSREALVELPGVGRKTANVVLNAVFGQPTLAVDTHIFRLGNRLLLAPGRTPEQVEAGLMRIIPPEYMRHAHHWLILHGRYVCKARKPDCPRCVIADLCKSPEKWCSTPAPLVPIPPGEDAAPV